MNERLRNHLSDHDVQSVRYAGFSGIKNGEVLDAAESAGFQVLLTEDQGFGHQQNLAGRKIALVIFRTRSFALAVIPEAKGFLLEKIKPGDRRNTWWGKLVKIQISPDWPLFSSKQPLD